MVLNLTLKCYVLLKLCDLIPSHSGLPYLFCIQTCSWWLMSDRKEGPPWI